MDGNSTFTASSSGFGGMGMGGSGSAYYEKLSEDFSACHLNPMNVLLHLVTTPIGVIGVLNLLHRYTKSSSAALALTALYAITLVPVVPNGVFIGTMMLCGLIVFLARQVKLGMWAFALIAIGFCFQDLAHMGTGEITFQSTYSGEGNDYIDFSSPLTWLTDFSLHLYYLLPLCVHITLPFWRVSEEIKAVLNQPLPVELQQVYAFAWLLGPLIVFALGSYCLDSKNAFCVFPGTPYFHRVLLCNLKDEGEPDGKGEKPHTSKKADLSAIRDWVLTQNPAEEKSTHFWFGELSKSAQQSFINCSESSQINATFRSLFSERHYCLDTVWGMNEVYVTGPKRDDDAANSDNVFYTRHVDGPFGLLPFVSVYRCIVGMDKNHLITTHFPLAGIGSNACEGDVLAFDFNREVHYITNDESKRDISDKFRVVLKLHYCVYPRVLAPLGWLMSFLNTRYNEGFRALFLKTINPTNIFEHFLAWHVNTSTVLMEGVETLFGQRNVLYLLFVAGLWRATGVYEVFFALTSFVHYFRYISTFYIRKGIDFGSFKRDVLLFKSVALAQLFYHYFYPANEVFALDWISVAMIVSGYAVSMMATNALGVDRTYFASELGLLPPKWVTQFPYGYIPHPMIVSQVWALLGLYKAAHFRAEWPFVVPIHVALYVTHMLQEEFGIYDKVNNPMSGSPQSALDVKDE